MYTPLDGRSRALERGPYAKGATRVSHNPPFKSDTRAVTLGTTLDLFDFVPLLGPGGGRVVVDKFIICITGTLTVATAAWSGLDVPRLMSLITVEQRDGKQRWNLSGYKSRLASIYYNGIEEYLEHAQVAVGASQTIDLRLIIPMAKRKIRRGKDFALPADLFRKVTLNFATLGGAATGTAVLSAPSLNVYILAEWHEETSVEFKAEDVIKSVDFNSNTQAKLALSGAVHDLFVCKEDTTSGGAVITAITDARIEDLGTPVLTRQDLVASYTWKRQLSPTASGGLAGERFGEPVREGKVLPIIAADTDTSLWEGRVVETMKIDVGTGLAGLSAVSREVTEKSQANYNATVARFGVDPRIVRMKTESKTRRGLGDGWTKREQLVGTWSAPLGKAS